MITKGAHYNPDEIYCTHRLSDEAQDTVAYFRRKYRCIAEQILKQLPEGRERDEALTKLEEASMWTNACISRRFEPITKEE